jgi:aryl-alcohol dehydrogenase-like predicted oxidoreductase
MTKSVARLALGTVQFGLPYGIANQSGQVTRLEIKAMLQTAMANGIDMLDTAIAYGESETCLGQVGVNHWNVVTKLPAVPESCPDVGAWVKDQVKASLERLGMTDVYGLLLHRPDQLLGENGTSLFRALQTLKENGQVHKVGVSIYAPSELEALTSKYHFDLVQAPFNLIDRRLYATGWLDRLKCDGVEVHTRSVFLQGLLLMPFSAIPAQFSPWNDLWRRWHDWLKDRNVTAVEASLAYPFGFPEIDKVVVGADNAIQLARIIDAANMVLQTNLPDLECDDQQLINPSRWN